VTGPLFFETRAHLMVCTGKRCRERGSAALFERLWSAMEREGLAYYARGGAVRLTESGCLGACSHGPNATCYFAASYFAASDDAGRPKLDQAWYADMDGPRLLELARALNDGAELPARGRYDR